MLLAALVSSNKFYWPISSNSSKTGDSIMSCVTMDGSSGEGLKSRSPTVAFGTTKGQFASELCEWVCLGDGECWKLRQVFVVIIQLNRLCDL